MNALVGERMSVVNRKPQTTRHRILGIVNTDAYQIVFSDTPGHIDMPQYALHKSMNRAIRMAFEDADIMLYMTTVEAKSDIAGAFFERTRKLEVPLFLLINKIDLSHDAAIDGLITEYAAMSVFDQIFPVSAKTGAGLDTLMEAIVEALPAGPPYYPKDQLTDKPERFFVSEIIRDHLLTLYHKEVPYSCEVEIESFQETEDSKGQITKIRALIYVNRRTQKSIIIGKGGEAIKRLGTRARKDIETFLESRVYLELYVKVRDNWRDDDRSLRRFGY